MDLPAIYEYYAVIPHRTHSAVFLLHTENGWSLPCWQTTKRHFWQTCDHINQTIQDLLALRVITLRCLFLDQDTESGHFIRVHELENRDAYWLTPANGSWIGFSEFKTLPLTHPMQREVLEAWFTEQIEGIPLSRRAWARAGWFDETADWMVEQLRGQDMMVNDTVKQIRTWERSCLLRVETTLGQVYCKAVPAMFAHELPLTQHLDVYCSSHAPSILAVNRQRNLLLLRDFGGPKIGERGNFAWWEEAVYTFAILQREMVTHADSLVAIGCPARTLDDLTEDIRTLLADTEALFIEGKGLNSSEIAALRAQLPRFLNLCQELKTYQLPYTLEHGDFSPTNVAWVEQKPLFFDWSDSSIAHPFFSLCLFPEEMETTFPDTPDWQMRQRSAYLRPWMSYEPLERLTRAFEIAQHLAPLHHASRYHGFILPHMEAKWEMALMIPAYLRCLL
ncbi:phosphotransferase [Dictyobacter formicarum]|uniref:Aminoglycoside phosphotransferase domain-containing protein n=1 Tax=Dictyobacter formicarum TaxID=2778368 RepID=A0ABQ3VT05_9CHLR|nr:phosphotransferase [Dictyobacter formicarum]GHO89417.1 hypothetical protein KSZ_74230 [Dictyobacter formicarum]